MDTVPTLGAPDPPRVFDATQRHVPVGEFVGAVVQIYAPLHSIPQLLANPVRVRVGRAEEHAEQASPQHAQDGFPLAFGTVTY